MPESKTPNSSAKSNGQDLVFGVMQEGFKNAGNKDTYFNAQGPINYGNFTILFNH